MLCRQSLLVVIMGSLAACSTSKHDSAVLASQADDHVAPKITVCNDPIFADTGFELRIRHEGDQKIAMLSEVTFVGTNLIRTLLEQESGQFQQVGDEQPAYLARVNEHNGAVSVEISEKSSEGERKLRLRCK